MNINFSRKFKWIPRIITILYIGFISLFALDAFSCEYSILEALAGFLIHLIPSLVLGMVLFIAWKKERFGGILFMLFFLVFTCFFHTYRNWLVFAVISLPLLIVGVLFVICPTTGSNQKEKITEEINNQDLSEKDHK